uniref:hypothetical protein n=1 Tax=Rhodococcus sp. R1101 TaxID=1170698 RepID=UPI0003798EB8
ELGDRTVTVRLDGTDAVLAVHSEPAAPHEDPTPSFEEMTGDISRVTLRLVEQIKTKAEEAAQQSGLSLNSWMAQAVQGALREQMRYQRRADEWRRRGGWAEPTPTAPTEQQPSERHDTTGPDDTAGRDDTDPRADT